ncbi:hypothetical protein [Streptomyces sp. CB02115]|uniref:hypothetical protein n=1 Tax=Streptomyces sp. CB02115 TaxID=1703939 RepID=UPI00093E1515|nr:hypothetical protein [Streptomyces sp. CB02115]OKJ46840.1 hypothetical protein AMK28_37295 [Streptomyces sp. CB02115]
MSADTATAVAAISLGLQALRAHALADTADHQAIAEVLATLYDDHRDRRDGSVLGLLSALITDLGIRIGDQIDEDIAETVDEAAGYVQDAAGSRLERARALLAAPPTEG